MTIQTIGNSIVYIKEDTGKKSILVYGNNRNYAMNMHETEKILRVTTVCLE